MGDAPIGSVPRTKAEKDGHAAAVAALVLQKVGAMLGANLHCSATHAGRAYKLGGVKLGGAACGFAGCVATKVGLAALETGVVRILGHGKGGLLLLSAGNRVGHAVVLKAKASFASNLVVKRGKRRQQLFQGLGLAFDPGRAADGAHAKAKRDAGPVPAHFEQSLDTIEVEDVAAVHLAAGWRGGKVDRK